MLKMTRRDNRDMIPRRIFELSHQGAAPLCVTERRYWAGDAEAGYGTVSFYTAQRHDGVDTLCLSGTQLRVSFERREDALCLLHAQLSTDPADVITLSDHNGNDVSVRPFTVRWRRGVVVSGVRRLNEVNARRARLVLGRVTVFGWVYHLGM